MFPGRRGTTGRPVTRPIDVGQVIRFVPALERLAVRQISLRFLSQDERIEIADLQQAGLGHPSDCSAARLGSINGLARAAPQPDWGSGLPSLRCPPARDRASRPQPCATHRDQHGLKRVVTELLDQRWSPQQISRNLRSRFPEEPRMWLCHESIIYQAIYRPGSALLRPSRLAPQHRSPLRSGGDHRRAHQRTERRRALWTPSSGRLFDQLLPGQSLGVNQSLLSTDHRFVLVMQSDGNLVDYKGGTALWSTRTNGNTGATAIM